MNTLHELLRVPNLSMFADISASCEVRN